MLAGTRSGGPVRAYQQLVAARRLARTPDDGPLLDVLPKMVNLVKTADALSIVSGVAFSPDGRRIHTATTRRKRCQTTSATTTFTHSANTEKCCGS